ncbi:MAG TPA: DMT family transporter [Candidatus Pelagibacter bacterium]|jgi:drug/metabolite transporter (DMT)-like permease|nr:EamA family transporter [Pelagibacteraceae bacterium]HJN84130.1 DMT family transporter [Candidatus Pelagibacter bacterium]|tara:strand:+ start:3923 stop:4828 length:906 start_codon:yes stop_codon:yes gene_type:complete
MFDSKNEKLAIPLVLIAGLFWSFGPLVVRNIDDANTIPWQYLFSRGLVIFLLLNIYLIFNEGFDFYKNYLRIGISGIIGGIGLGTANITFIWSITNTTAAITLLCLAAMPFITALLGFLFLKEKISIGIWMAIFTACIGVAIMAIGSSSLGSVNGLIFGLASAFGFSIFSVSLRWRKETPKFTTVAIAGLFCCLFSFVIIVQNDLDFLSSSKNESLFALHGTLVCLGLILYSIGSRVIPAAELTLLSLTEVIGGIFWVWIPILGINEIPSNNTIIGGFLIFMAIIYYSLVIKNNRRFIGLT